MPASTKWSSKPIRSAGDIELASLVVPKIASPSAPWSSSQRQKAVNRPASGSPLAVNGVRTGTSTPANGCAVILTAPLNRLAPIAAISDGAAAGVNCRLRFVAGTVSSGSGPAGAAGA